MTAFTADCSQVNITPVLNDVLWDYQIAAYENTENKL
jgi:hypothetical protein